MRLFAVAAALGSAASQAEASGGAAKAKDGAPLRPNIIFNLVDDLGWNDVSWHREGGNIVKTPYLESLANSGTKLQNYCERSRCPLPAPALPAPCSLARCADIYRFCSPSRSTFMTGRHPSHIGQQTQMNLNP